MDEYGIEKRDVKNFSFILDDKVYIPMISLFFVIVEYFKWLICVFTFENEETCYRFIFKIEEIIESFIECVGKRNSINFNDNWSWINNVTS